MAEPVQRTLAILKPDVMKQADRIGYDNIAKIMNLLEEHGLTAVRIGDHRMSISQAEDLYALHKNKHHFDGTTVFMTAYPSRFLLLEGPNAVEVLDKLKGNTDPTKAVPGTIRALVPCAGGPANAIHASDTEERAAKEIALVESWGVWKK